MILKDFLETEISELVKEYELIKVKDVDKAQGVNILLDKTAKLETLLNDRPIVKFLGFTIVAKEVEPGALCLAVREDEELNGAYYLFDCMGVIFEIPGYPTNFIKADAFKNDKEAVNYGANYEATVIKYEFTNGERTGYKVLYEPAF